MSTQELHDILIRAGFKEEKLDSGLNYSKRINHIELICYVEPNINIAFMSIYKWNNNDVKGTHNLSMTEFGRNRDSISSDFKKTLDNMPEFIGEKINVHQEVRKVIDDTFNL